MCMHLVATTAFAIGSPSSSFPCATTKDCTALSMWHIPGPNPIVSPFGTEFWMSHECEVAGGVTKAHGTYYFIYHCLGTTGYQVAVSTASHPLGPWTLPPGVPNLPTTPGGWDKDVTASFNILPDPDVEGQWLGYYEGGMPDGQEDWTLGLAKASSPLGPWEKYAGNPILQGNATCDSKREFQGVCSGLYVAAVMYGAHTNNEFWLYVEAPINDNDEGPMALWTSTKAEGPFVFKAYVLDGAGEGSATTGGWDSGRYSESRVEFHNGLFHLFATASAVGNPHPNKVNEQIGWAVSADGFNFVEHPHNPLAPFTESTPHTQAMAEGHVWFEDEENEGRGLVYVYHTLRWDDGEDAFAANGRNAEDLGVEIFSPSSALALSMPIITANWLAVKGVLQLAPGASTPCSYDWVNYQYCVPIKAIIGAAGETKVLHPALSFELAASCVAPAGQGGNASVEIIVSSYSYANGVNTTVPLKRFSLSGACNNFEKGFRVKTPAVRYDSVWVVATVKNVGGTKEGGSLVTVDSLDVKYANEAGRMVEPAELPAEAHAAWSSRLDEERTAAHYSIRSLKTGRTRHPLPRNGMM